MNINIDKKFNNYIKSNFNGLSAYTLAQVIADFIRNGWDTAYYTSDDDMWFRYHSIRPFAKNKTVDIQIDFKTFEIIDNSHIRLASFLVQEDLFLAFTRRNNPDLIEVISDIVRTCPYL